MGAITVRADGKIEIDRQICTNCGKCAEVCPAKAVIIFGQYLSTEEVLTAVEEDGAFYVRSGGGITVGGGEAIFQAGFVHELLQKCRERGMDTAVEICGYGRWEDVEKVCRHANLIFYDIKHMDSGMHRDFTGVANELILENLKRIFHAFPKTAVIVRTPVLPGFNDSEKDIQAIANFLAETKNRKGYELLPYHRFGESKYHHLGRKYLWSEVQSPNPKHMEKLRDCLNGFNPSLTLLF